MRASQLLRGYLQAKRTALPLAGSHRTLPSTDGPDPDAERGPSRPVVEVGLLPLGPGDEATIYANARAYAVAHGVSNPGEGEELYEYGKALWRCLLGVIDCDSDAKAPVPFFDGGLEQIEGMRELGKTGVLVLATEHQAYQDEVDGQLRTLTEEGGHAAVTRELAGPHGAPFWFSLGPGLQVTWALITARQLLS